MTSLSRSQVLHIAALARLELTSEEIDKMTSELSSILTYVEMLNEVNTDTTEPTAQVTGLTNALRDDVITPLQAKPEDLIGCSPLPILERQIQVPHAHG